MRSLKHPAILLTLLMGAGAYLRLKGLTFQSLWLDELHTMIEAKPVFDAAQVVRNITRSDPHPPFYFLLIHVWLKLFGYNDYSARLLSAAVGVAAIPSIYLLGKELYSEAAGSLSAIFTTFNYYAIYYSQEARGYMLAFLFTILSFLFFLKCIRDPSRKNAVWYVVFTTLLVHTHYYGLLILFCQFLIALILMTRGREMKRFLIYFGIVVLLYAPWIPVMILVAKRTSFWIPKPDATFLVSYFEEYFNKDLLTIFLYLILLLLFVAGAFLKKGKSESYKFAFLILIVWILGTYLIPYVKSLISVPILFPRYTIVIVPAIVLAAAIGTELLPRPAAILVAALLIAFSGIHLFIFGHYYEKPTKTQWREMAQFLHQEYTNTDPIISDRQWHLGYYFSVFNIKPRFVPQQELKHLNSIWVVTGHHGNPVSAKTQKILNRHFEIKKSFNGLGCSAVFYTRKDEMARCTRGPNLLKLDLCAS